MISNSCSLEQLARMLEAKGFSCSAKVGEKLPVTDSLTVWVKLKDSCVIIQWQAPLQTPSDDVKFLAKVNELNSKYVSPTLSVFFHEGWPIVNLTWEGSLAIGDGITIITLVSYLKMFMANVPKMTDELLSWDD